MIRGIVLSVSMLVLSACSSFQIPSFYDDNESILAVELQWDVQQLDCNDPLVGATEIRNSLGKFILYSHGKESSDIGEMLRLMGKTVSPFYERASNSEKPMSPAYCELKKKILLEQADDITQATMGRY